LENQDVTSHGGRSAKLLPNDTWGKGVKKVSLII
jgi:hypothetical protein